MSAALRTRLKIADLTAWTALDTARRLLPSGYGLDRLVREEFYLFEPAPGFAADAFEAPLLHAIERSNFFVNPNKEQFQFFASSTRGAMMEPFPGAWGILTRARDGTEDEGLRTRLLEEHPMEGLGAIRRGRIWWLVTRAPAGAAGNDAAYDALGPVRGSRRGLLLNPNAEAALRLEGPTEWRLIESFMTEPARSVEAVA